MTPDLQYEGASKEKQDAMDLAESSRETEWNHPSFVAELFLGRFRDDLIFPYPEQDSADKKEGDAVVARLETFVRENVDADAIDREGKMPQAVLDGYRKNGAFSLKIPKEYGGLGLSQTNYMRVLQMIAGHCHSSTAWLSAHQSIGVPQPLKMFGTPEQKKKYMPLLTEKVSAFALTEPGAGSDPAGMTTTAVPTPDGRHFIINGRKLWCTNGAVADILVVMCRTPSKTVNDREKKQITAFLVEKGMPGFRVVHRCQFMGLRGIENALLEFKDVKVPRENIIWGEGQGLKLALMTLNVGRLSLPASCSGGVKKILEWTRQWAGERVQWGAQIGKHEEIAAKVASMAAHAFAIDAITWWAAVIADKGNRDIRLEAAMCKLFASEQSYKIVNDALQIRGGRGFESADSLRARGGEHPFPIERFYRDGRINTILEGSTEVMHLFIAREALDAHMRLSSDLLSPKTSLGKKLKAFFKAGLFYAAWYPRQWLHWGRWPLYSKMGPVLSGHFRYVSRTSHRLARSIFHLMMIHRLGLERRQLVLARVVEIGTDLFAMAATCSRAHMLLSQNPGDESPRLIADEFCRHARTRIDGHFRNLYCNFDSESSEIAAGVMAGKFSWLEDGTIKGNVK